MNKRELYNQIIRINDIFYMQIDKDNNDFVNIYKDNQLIEKFKLNRKIYTLFKILQEHIQSEDYIIVEDFDTKIYGEEIHLYDDIYIKVNADHACLTLDFYQKLNDTEIKLIYLTKLIYTCKKLFHKLLIPKKIELNTNYYITNVYKFIDMMEILSYEGKNMNIN